MRTEEYVTLKRNDSKWHKVSLHLSRSKASNKLVKLTLAQQEALNAKSETAQLWRARKLLWDHGVASNDSLRTTKVLPLIYKVEKQAQDHPINA